MKTVLLLRHAKSSWDEPYLTDSLRPLAPRGRQAAPRIGAHMARNGFIPDQVLCSSARRARETWELASEFLDDAIPVEIRDDLYDASPGRILTMLQEVHPSVDTVLLVGHNPTFEDLALSLTDRGPEELVADLRRKYPTGTLAVLEFPIDDWAHIRPGTGYLRGFIRPRTLR